MRVEDRVAGAERYVDSLRESIREDMRRHTLKPEHTATSLICTLNVISELITIIKERECLNQSGGSSKE